MFTKDYQNIGYSHRNGLISKRSLLPVQPFSRFLQSNWW